MCSGRWCLFSHFYYLWNWNLVKNKKASKFTSRSYLLILVFSGHTVHRKKTHANQHLHTTLHHHPAQLQAISRTLIWLLRLTNTAHWPQELWKIKTDLQNNSFSNRAINHNKKKINPWEQQHYHIWKAPQEKLPEGAKDKIHLHQEIYKILCSDCNRTYMGQRNCWLNESMG